MIDGSGWVNFGFRTCDRWNEQGGITMKLSDLSAKRAATLSLRSLLLGACPILVVTSDLAAQSSILADQPGPVVRQIPESTQAGGQTGAPAASTQAGKGGAPEPSSFTELKEALAAAQAKLEELSRAAEAVTPVGELRQELQAALEENQLLTSDIATLAESRRELQSSNEAAQARIAEMTAAALDATAEIERLRAEVDVLRSGNAELSANLQRVIRKVLEANRRHQEIARAEDALASAARDREEAKVTIDQLRSRLVAAKQRVSEVEAINASLSADLQALQTAASNAAEVARQNLKALTSRVETLTAAMGSDAEGASGPEAPAATSSETGQGEPSRAQAIPEAIRPGGSDQESATAKALPPAPVGEPPAHSGLSADLSAMESKEKLQVAALLTDLKPVAERSGLLMTVPGGPLFRADSDEIKQTSYPTLAKLAELLNIYRSHRVLIVGHTDASGEAAYNQMLSQRRADLVKQFLVDNFEIDAARLATAGQGENAPIASNRTLAGREANRRVEVLLLN
jgi:outer membrane protein OmpA-like peptidoglycan-associated protein